MTTERLLIAAAFSALVLGTQAYAAPGGGGGNPGGGQPGGKPKMEQPAKSMDRTETQTREQKELHNPGTGDQVRERTEATEQNRDQAQNQGQAKGQGQGQATSQQMQERQEQRKQIQEETRSTQTKGDQAGKKPWWKFWESDDDA